MKEKEQLLRIRPFNMANFSGAGGYIPMAAMFGAFFSFPATFFLWAGLAVPLKTEDGTIDFLILKRRLKRIALPICMASSILWIIYCVSQLFSYGSDLSAIMLAVWASAVHSVGMYLPIYCSATVLDKNNNLTKGKWFLLTLAFAVLMVIIGVLGTFLLMALMGI